MPHIQAIGFYMISQWTAVNNLTAITESDSQINLAWDIVMAGMTGIIIEYSTNGTDFSYLDFVGGTEVAYNATGLTTNTQYWFRLQGVKSGSYSLYSDIADDWTSVTLTVSARGDGSGIAAFVIKVSSPLVLNLSGSAKFYTDAAGTLGESSTTTVAATGALVTKYIKCPSGTCNLQFMDANFLIGFGHALNLGSTNPVWVRSIGGGYDANTPGLNATNWHFPYCVDIGVAYPAIVTFISDLSSLPQTIERAVIVSSATITGELSDIGASCVLFSLSGANSISGNLSDMPPAMEYFGIGGSNTITGDITNLPDSLIRIDLTGNNTVYGDIANLPQSGNLTTFYVTGYNTISGSVADLDYSGIVLDRFSVYGSNTISGAPADIPASITRFELTGNNTFSGDIANFSATLDYILIGGNYSSLTGDISDLPEGLLSIIFSGVNDITGDIANLPSTLTYCNIAGSNTISGNVSGFSAAIRTISIAGSNTITGDISGIPDTITSLGLSGNNTVSGNISGLPTSATSIDIQGSNTLTGSVAGLPSGITRFYVQGNNTISGTIADIPSGITQFYVQGNNTITGDLADISNSITYFILQGANTVNTYTSGKTWSNGFTSSFINTPVAGGGLDATEIDNLFIDLDTSWTTTRKQTISMIGTHAAPTATSLAARNSLIAKGRTIIVNT